VSEANSLVEKLRTTNFTRCARCGAVAPRVLSHSAAKIADGAHFFEVHFARRRELLRAQNGLRRRRLQPFRRVKSTLADIEVRYEIHAVNNPLWANFCPIGRKGIGGRIVR